MSGTARDAGLNVRPLLLADESLRGPIVHGLRRHHPSIDIVVASAIGLESWPDPRVLEWAALHNRTVVAQDKRTMIGFAEDRLAAGLPFAGLIVVPQKLPVGLALRDLAALVSRSNAEPLVGQIRYLPLDKSWRVCEEEPAWATAAV